MHGDDGPSVSLSVTLQGVNDSIKHFLESALEQLAAEAQQRLQQQQQQQQPGAATVQDVLWSGSLRIEGGLTLDKLRRYQAVCLHRHRVRYRAEDSDLCRYHTFDAGQIDQVA
eukprot:1160727-Pelagomonas_calceolata.AAC.34